MLVFCTNKAPDMEMLQYNGQSGHLSLIGVQYLMFTENVSSLYVPELFLCFYHISIIFT
uniref:Uncharacterized protein n=1 Tax=Arundo donax TaxID=35708 RepID=A0A0A9E2Z0_ARUDO